MKAYCVYQPCGGGFADGDLHAMLVREDGEILADHICSNPTFVYGDLWGRRKERQEEHKDLQVIEAPIPIEAFKSTYPDIFARTFVETDDNQ